MHQKKTLSAMLNQLRQQLAFLLLATSWGNATTISYYLGYSSLYHFSRRFLRTLHFRPSQWQQHLCL